MKVFCKQNQKLILKIGEIEYAGYLLRETDCGAGEYIVQIVFKDIPVKKLSYRNVKLWEFYMECIKRLFDNRGINNVFSYKGKLCVGFVEKRRTYDK